MAKQMYLSDNIKWTDMHTLQRSTPWVGDDMFANNKGTEIILRDHVTGKVLQRVHNKVTIAGAQFTACKHFDIPAVFKFPSYNKTMNLDNSVYTAPENTEKCYLFCCGTNGCSIESSMELGVNYTKRIQPSELVPFIYNVDGSDIGDSFKQKYFGKKTALDGTIAYYFKAFDTEPVLNLRYADGTNVDETIYNPTNTKNAETYIELMMRITRDDFRNFFIANNSLNKARINSISLLTAWYTEDEYGIRTYQNILPLTELHFSNEPLTDTTKAIDITYHIFY